MAKQKKHLHVRRRGIGVKTLNLSKFRKWLDAQPRSKLTYGENIQRKDELGWTTEDFVEEAKHRGLVGQKYGTASKWCLGVIPAEIAMGELTKHFKGIQFGH